jgi:hypothetical protein
VTLLATDLMFHIFIYEFLLVDVLYLVVNFVRNSNEFGAIKLLFSILAGCLLTEIIKSVTWLLGKHNNFVRACTNNWTVGAYNANKAVGGLHMNPWEYCWWLMHARMSGSPSDTNQLRQFATVGKAQSQHGSHRLTFMPDKVLPTVHFQQSAVGN